MFRKIIVFFIVLFAKQSFGIELYIQNDSIPKVSYEAIYDVEIEENLIYGYGLKHESFDFDNPTVKPLKLDVYRPENNFKNRPVLVLIHLCWASSLLSVSSAMDLWGSIPLMSRSAV